MIVAGPVLFLVGLALCWVIGRYALPWDGILIPTTTALFGIAGLLVGFPDLWVDHFIWSLLVLAAYGGVGAMIFRAGRSRRGGAE